MQLTVITPIGPHHVDLFRQARASVLAQTVPVAHLYKLDTEQRGPGAVRNDLLRLVQTPLVAFLDADDLLEPLFAERTLAAFQRGRYVYTDWWQRGEHKHAPDCAWRKGTFHLVTAVVPTDLALGYGGFDETLDGMEDTDFFVKLIWHHVCGLRVPEPLVHYRPEGGRGKGIHQNDEWKRYKAIIDERYGGKPLGCCGDEGTIDTTPVGVQREGDILAQAMWMGNRAEVGRATRRRYPRMSYPRTTWVSPADIAAAPHQWQIMPEVAADTGPKPDGAQISPPPPAPSEPQPAPDKPPEVLYGIAALEAQWIERGHVTIPPPPVVLTPLDTRPNVGRVVRLGLKRSTGEQLPCFVAPYKEYPSYSDFWKLVELSGFEVRYPDGLYLYDPNNTYVFVTPEGIPNVASARARTIFWQLEYVGDYTQQPNRATCKELWASDPAWAAANGARFILLGSHAGLAEDQPKKRKRYDVVMLAYMTARREQMRKRGSDLRWPEQYPGHEGPARADILANTHLMLHVQQHEQAALAPLRLALAAAYHLPFLGEAVPDAGPYDDIVRFAAYDELMPLAKAALKDKNMLHLEGQRLHRFLCEEHTFGREVMETLREE